MTSPIVILVYIHLLQCKAEGIPRCRRITDAFITQCKAALKNLITLVRVLKSEDPYSAFSEGIVNFHAHYCLGTHSFPWCYHEKVQCKTTAKPTMYISFAL